MSKFFQIIGLLFVLGIGTCVGGAYFFWHSTEGVADVGTRLLKAAHDGKLHDAYVASSPALKTQKTEAQFIADAAALHLQNYTGVTWSDRFIDNERGHVSGTVGMSDRSALPLTVEMVRVSGGWQLLGFHRHKDKEFQ